MLCSALTGTSSMALVQEETKHKFNTKYRERAKKYGIAAVVLMAVGGISEGIREKIYRNTIIDFTNNFSTSDTPNLVLGVSGAGFMAAGLGCGVVAVGYFIKDLYAMAEYKLYLLEKNAEKTN